MSLDSVFDPEDRRLLIELLATLAWSGDTVVSLDGRAWGELRRLADEAVVAQQVRARGPAPWVSRRDVTVREDGDRTIVEATWTVFAPTPGLFEARLATGLDVLAVDVDGRPWGASLGRVDAPLEAVAVTVVGRTQIHLVGEVHGDGPVSFMLLPGAGIVTLPTDLVLLDASGAARVDERWFVSGASLTLAPRPSALARDEAALMTGRSAVGVTVGDGEVTVRARVGWSLRRGRVSTVSLSVPGAGADLTVHGANVASTSRSGDRIDVSLAEPTTDGVTLEISWTSPMSADAAASVTLPQVTPLGTLSTERVLTVARDTDIEVVPRFERGESAGDGALPEWADGLVTGTPTAVRRGETAGRIDLLRFVPAERPALVVDVAEWFVAAAGDGRTIAQGTLSVRNERASSLRLGLKPGMRLLAVQVEGRPVAAVVDPDGWRIPLPRSVETMRGLLTFPVELTVIQTEDAAWADGAEAQVALPTLDAEVAVRRVTLHLPRGVRARGEDGEHGQVEAFSEGEGLAYGFAEGVDSSRASALYQDALGAWMKNDFGEAQARLDELRSLGAENENVTRLQSNLDLVGGDADVPGDEALARRLKDQARARSLAEEQRQEDVLRYADEQLAAGNDEAAAEAYAAAAETADKLARLEQSESDAQQVRAREAKKKEAVAQTRNTRGGRAPLPDEALHGELGGAVSGLGGLGVRGSGSGGGGAADGWWRLDSPDQGLDNAPAAWSPAAEPLTEVPPSVPAPDPSVWATAPSEVATPVEHAQAADVVSVDGDMELDARGFEATGDYLERVPGSSSSTVVVLESARAAPRGPTATPRRAGAKGVVATGSGRGASGVSVQGTVARGEVVVGASPPSAPPAVDREVHEAPAVPRGVVADPKPVDALAPLEVTATSAAVVIPALGETVRFQQLLLAPGADVPVTLRVDLPRRFR